MRGRRVRMVIMATALSGAGLSGVIPADPGNQADPLAEFDSYPPAIKGERCVAPLEIMGLRHMELLDLQKDRAILRGLRNQRFSLQQCVDCHGGAGREADPTEPQRIDAPGQFCAGCHEYAGVRIDCFSCHVATPRVDNDKEDGGAGDQRLSAQSFTVDTAWTNRRLPGGSGD